ncbi:hypothetical protein NGR_b10490 (plasmid) [Sinorhizobium fredii NGR234]|uniref:Uncharacterized protein n=1 Tax=Sinorhizobium fredii (strain NBRC 101917 / NGR234) TaxID=394 RepID=C3KQZ4_SINFN|nr:hypothetical protein NGR_b10490 [Sinorhizobium fredii NGR234]
MVLLTKPAPIARMARLPVAMCLANTDGSDGRARTDEWGKDHSSDGHRDQLHPVLPQGLQAAYRRRVDLGSTKG